MKELNIHECEETLNEIIIELMDKKNYTRAQAISQVNWAIQYGFEYLPSRFRSDLKKYDKETLEKAVNKINILEQTINKINTNVNKCEIFINGLIAELMKKTNCTKEQALKQVNLAIQEGLGNLPLEFSEKLEKYNIRYFQETGEIAKESLEKAIKKIKKQFTDEKPIKAAETIIDRNLLTKPKNIRNNNKTDNVAIKKLHQIKEELLSNINNTQLKKEQQSKQVNTTPKEKNISFKPPYQFKEELLLEVESPIATPTKIEKLVERYIDYFINREKYKTSHHPQYDCLIKTNSKDKKIKLPDKRIAENFYQKMKGREEISRGIFRQYSTFDYEASDITDRLYINIEKPEDIYKFVECFTEKCDRFKMPTCIKIIDYNLEGIDSKELIPEQYLRDDNIVIYCNEFDLPVFTNICMQIEKEMPELSYKEPPVLTGKIDNVIGYGEDPLDKNNSYNSIRSNIIFYAIETIRKKYGNKKFYEATKDKGETHQKFLKDIYNEIKEYSIKEKINPETFFQNIKNIEHYKQR